MLSRDAAIVLGLGGAYVRSMCPRFVPSPTLSGHETIGKKKGRKKFRVRGGSRALFLIRGGGGFAV